jgi:hypothetical protein
MPDPGDRIAAVEGAGVAVVDVEIRARHADPCGITHFVAVADVAVAARRSLWYRVVGYARRWIAGIDRAGVAVVDARCLPCQAHALPVAGLVAVAQVPVAARLAQGPVDVNDPRDGVAGVNGTGIAVVDRRRGSRHADPESIAGFIAIAGVPVAAVGARRGGFVHGAGDRVAGIDGAGIAVVGIQRHPFGATPRRVANLGAIADIAVAA